MSRLALGLGEGGGFPAATRAVAEWFAVRDRATAMGIINAGTAVGAVIAPPLIVLVLTRVGWLGIANWRWVFFLTGAWGWSGWRPGPHSIIRHAPAGRRDREDGSRSAHHGRHAARPPPIVAVAFAKFLTDAAWYFYLFWLPKYLFEAQHFDLRQAGSVGWIPYAASGVGCLFGGGFSSHLLRRGASVNAARKMALGASAALMPWVMLVPQCPTPAW